MNELHEAVEAKVVILLVTDSTKVKRVELQKWLLRRLYRPLRPLIHDVRMASSFLFFLGYAILPVLCLCPSLFLTYALLLECSYTTRLSYATILPNANAD